MKTNNTKSQIIRRFADSIDEFCKTEQDVVNLIDSVEMMMNFFISAKQVPLMITLDLLSIKEIVSKYSNEKLLRASEDGTDLIVKTIALANCLEKQNNRLFEIMDGYSYQPALAMV